ncbi:MAG: phytanoyl-CoA dioxygenase family protein [Acidimicrobiales bacterium]
MTATQATAAIPQCSAGTDPGEMYALLDEAGCLVINDMATASTRDAVRGELAAHLDAADPGEDDPGAFYPGKTRRVVALMERSPTAREQMMMNPQITELCDRHLLGNCNRYQLHVTAALEVGPGSRDQILHREEDSFPFFPLPRPNLIIATMWAMSDFTADNGGTQLVPGSHRWEAGRVASPEEVVRAEMPAGSVLVWLGGTIHAAGANTTDDWRYGIILSYSLGWLRQEENQHLSLSLPDAFALPDETRDRMGFAMDYNDSLGFYDPTVLL